jgi:hypothetical protein
MWLTGRLAPDHKTIADFRKDNGRAIRKVCSQFVALCRRLDLFADASVAIDGSKFKAVNNRDRNFTRAKMQRRMAQIEESVARYLQQLDSADRQEPSQALASRTERLTEKIAKLRQEMQRLEGVQKQMLATPDQQVSFTDPDARSMATSGRGSGVVGYNAQVSVDTTHHLIAAHKVTNTGNDRSQLAPMSKKTKAALGVEKLDVVADRATSTVARSLNVTGRISPSPCRSRRPRLPGRGAALENRISAMWPATMFTSVRPASAWPSTTALSRTV